MKPATVSELKKALIRLSHDDLLDACLRLAKFKADNKELLTYVLMKSADEQAYAREVCEDIDGQMPASGSIHKKTMRKIVRSMEKSIRFSGDKETELQVRIHFCRQFVERGVRFGHCRISATCTLRK